MLNWSVDIGKLKKDPEKYRVWKIEQLVNYGLDSEKLDRKEVKKVWLQIQDKLDPYKKRTLEYLLWGKQYSLPNNLSFWSVFKKSQK